MFDLVFVSGLITAVFGALEDLFITIVMFILFPLC